MSNQSIKDKTLGALLKSLEEKSLYEKEGSGRYFKTTGKIMTFDKINIASEIKKISWFDDDFNYSETLFKDKVKKNKALDVVNHNKALGEGVIDVSNSVIIKQIYQEISEGADDARIMELIKVMKHYSNNDNPDDDEAGEILQKIKNHLLMILDNRIIKPVCDELNEKIIKLDQDPSAKDDSKELTQIKNDIGDGQFQQPLPDISQFKKRFDHLKKYLTERTLEYQKPPADMDIFDKAITRYTGLLRVNSTTKDINDAYDAVRTQCAHPRFKSFLEELIEARDNYFKQRTNIEKHEKAKSNLLNTRLKHKEYGVGGSISIILGVTVTGVIGHLLREAFKTPAVAAMDAIKHIEPATTVFNPISHNSTHTQSYEVIDRAATTGTSEQGPTGVEDAFIALVCIAIIALTIYIASRYFIRCDEDRKLNKSFSALNTSRLHTYDEKAGTSISSEQDAILKVENRTNKRVVKRESVFKEIFSI